MNSVGSKSAFKRSYLIFTNEDAGFEAGQKPSGHVKLEIRGGKGKLHAVAQNLRPGNGRFDYALYILRSGRNCAEPVRAGLMENKLSRWELEWTFDPIKLGMSGYPANDCDVIAILAEFTDRHKGGVVCPLAAYKNKPVEWRSGFRQAEPSNEALHVEYSNESKVEDKTVEEAAIIVENEGGDRDGAAIDAEIEGAGVSSVENKADEAKLGAEGETKTLDDSDNYDTARKAKEDATTDKGIQNSQPHACTNNIDTTCIYLNGNMCAALIQAEAGAANPCGVCQIRHGVQPANVRLPVDMTQLKKTLDSNFERSDPFHSNRRDYVWWKVTNPVNLNNILYLNSIRSPLLFNPAVMIAHYKYRHFIIGIFTHMDGQNYVVCGVPGMHMVDRKPFGELGTWVQTQGNRLRYGAFGYWLVYINPGDGKMLNLSQDTES